MTKISPPPIYEDLMESLENLKARIPWVLFFNQLYNGDTGTPWTPTFQNLTTVGTPTISGKYYQISKSLVYFSVTIVPATSTSATAGTTFIDNFPLKITQDGAVHAVSGLLGSQAGMSDAASNRIYPPAWSAVTVPLTIVGTLEAK